MLPDSVVVWNREQRPLHHVLRLGEQLVDTSRRVRLGSELKHTRIPSQVRALIQDTLEREQVRRKVVRLIAPRQLVFPKNDEPQGDASVTSESSPSRRIALRLVYCSLHFLRRSG